MLLAYLKRQYKLLLLLAGAVCVFASVFALYDLPLEAVAYAGVLCLALGLVLFAVGYSRFLRRHRELQQLLRQANEKALPLPPARGLLEEDYQALLQAVCQDRARLAVENENRLRELTDYYSLWAHQIKTPIAAMDLLLQEGNSPHRGELEMELLKIGQYVEMVLSYLRLDSFPAGDSAIVTNEVTLGLVADGALAEQLMNMDLARRTFRIHLNTDGTDSEKLACAKAILAVSAGKYGVASPQEMAEEFYAMYGGFLFLGIFLGLLFLLATVLIIYYKQISEGYEDQRRYQIMQQVGMSRREVGVSIRGQILLVFFLPLMTAGLHILAAFPMLCRIPELFGLYDVGLFALCTVGTLAVFAAVYALVYSLTARTYERIVSSAI